MQAGSMPALALLSHTLDFYAIGFSIANKKWSLSLFPISYISLRAQCRAGGLSAGLGAWNGARERNCTPLRFSRVKQALTSTLISRLDWKYPTRPRRNAIPHHTHVNNTNEFSISTSAKSLNIALILTSNPNKILTLTSILAFIPKP